MSPEARVAFIMSQVACCNAKLAAMLLQNEWDKADGRRPTYSPNEIENMPAREFSLGQNDVIMFLREG